MLLDVKLKGTPNEELIQGYPGIPATWPRVAGTVEIRQLVTSPKESSRVPLKVLRVSAALSRTDSIVVPSHRPSVTAQKREKSFLVTRQKEIFRSEGAEDTYYALDVPFVLSLPTNKAPCASIAIPKALESTYSVFLAVETVSPATSAAVTTNYQFPVRVRRFDTLATFGIFNKPIRGTLNSSDHLVDLEWSLPVSAYGPGDRMSVALRAQPNKDWTKSKKVKLKRFSAELVQLTTYLVPKDEPEVAAADHAESRSSAAAGGADAIERIETRTRVAKVAKEFATAEQEQLAGIAHPYEIEVPIPSVYLTDGNSGTLPKEPAAVGYSGCSAFTNTSSLFVIQFKLVIKARFNHAKDIEAEQPITISQFDHLACMNYMNSLVESAQRLKHLDSRPHPPRKWAEPIDTSVRIA